MIFKEKFDEDKAIYSFSDKIDQIFLTSDIEILDTDSEILIISEEFPVGLIEEHLGIASRLEYKVKKGTKYELLKDSKKTDFDHLIESFNKFHRVFSDKYRDNLYFLEQCLTPKTLKMIWENISDEKVEESESYIYHSLEKGIFDKYIKELRIICRYFSLFPLSDLAYWKGRNNEAINHFKQTKYDKALSEFLEISSSMEFLIPDIYNYISKCHYHLKDMSKAKEFAKKAYELDEKYIPALNNLAVYSIFEKDFANAEDYWEKILSIDSKNKKAKQNLKIIRENVK